MDINLYLVNAFKELNKTQKEIIKELDKPQSYVSALMNGKKKVGKDVANLLAEKYGFDAGAILTGYVDQNNQSNSLEEPKTKYNKELLTKNVLISNDTEIDILQNKNGNTYYMYEDGSVEIEVLNLPFPAYASYIQAYFDETQMMEELTTVRFAVDKVGKGNYMSFDIKGDSMNGGMLDDTPDGAKVLARELGKHLWQSFRPEKYGYILMTKDNIYHKDIVDYNSDNGKLTLHSRNPKCEDFTINLNDVYRIFYIIKRTF